MGGFNQGFDPDVCKFCGCKDLSTGRAFACDCDEEEVGNAPDEDNVLELMDDDYNPHNMPRFWSPEVCPPEWMTKATQNWKRQRSGAEHDPANAATWANFELYRVTDEVLTKAKNAPDRSEMEEWAQSQKQFECVDCGINTLCIHELYILDARIWRQSGLGPRGGMLCIGCLEGRLGREVAPNDFDYDTYPEENSYRYRGSDRLLMRLAGETKEAAE